MMPCVADVARILQMLFFIYYYMHELVDSNDS